MVNIEGEKLNIIPQQDKTNMTGGKIWHFNLPCEWGSHCLTVAASLKHGTARRLSTTIPKKTPFVEWGGGEEGLRGVAQTWHCTSPIPPLPPYSCPGKINIAQARHCTSPNPPKEPALCAGMGGGGDRGCSPWRVSQEWHCKSPIPPPKKPTILRGEQGGFTVALAKNDTASCLSPPRKTHHSCNGGVGKGVFTVALHKHGTARRLSPPSPPSCPG
jgi:hypothetical protein